MMDCLDLMAPSDEELLGFVLDGMTMSQEARNHLEHCSICQRRFARYKQTNDYLLAKLYRAQCPTAERLNLYCAVLLPSDDVMDIANHLHECPLCTAEVADLRHALADDNLFEDDTKSPLQTMRRIVATFMPWQPQLSTRSEVPITNWPRQYRAEMLDLSLHLSRSSNGEIMLLGLFTSIDPEESVDAFEGCRVELYRVTDVPQGDEHKGQPLMSTCVDDLGNIVFKAVPVAEYTMIVSLPETELVIEGLCIENG